jgi:C1A family cysteine protease
MTRAPARIIFGAVSIFLLLGGAAGPSPSDDTPHRTGLIPLGDEELAEVLATRPQITRVHLNWLGLERVNAVRKGKGRPPLDPALARPVGREVESVVGGRPAGSRIFAEAGTMAEDLPIAVDNSTLKYFPPIRDQGPLGSCAAFASTYYQLSHMTAFQRNWDIKDPAENARKFSPKWTYNLVNRGYDGGASFNQIYPILEKHGAATWAELPYDENFKAWCLDPTVWRNAIYVRPEQARVVYPSNIKELLTNGYVLVFGTFILSWQFTIIQDDPSTPDDSSEIGKSIGYWVTGQQGAHAMTIVGYNDAIWTDINGNGLVDPGEKGAFRIANSWGSSWQDGGLTWLAYDALENASAVFGAPLMDRENAFFDDVVWVLTARDSYSPRMVAEFTLYHPTRNQLKVTLGRSPVSSTTPESMWTPAALQGNTFDGSGGAFDGTTTPVDAGFVLDFSDLLVVVADLSRYHLGIEDTSRTDRYDSAAILRAFKLVDLTTDPPTETACADVPQTVDGDEIFAFVDYDYQGPPTNHPPALSDPSSLQTWTGTPSSTLCYRVHYYDEDGDPPSVANAVIDGLPRAMTLRWDSPADGSYELWTSLPLGGHDYYFSFQDSRGDWAREPRFGVLTGPEIFSCVIASCSPWVNAGNPAFVLTVWGQEFADGAVVQWESADRPTTFVSSSQLTIPVDAADVATGRIVPITVRNPDGGVSNTVGYQVRYTPPSFTSCAPNHASAGGNDFILRLLGARFAPGAYFYWNGTSKATTFIGPNELRVQVKAADIAAFGEQELMVLNPGPGGGLSLPRTFPVSYFTVEPSPRTVTVYAGQSARYGVSVKPQLAAFDLPVTLTLPGTLPKGVTASLSTNVVTPGSFGIGSALTLTTTSRTSPGVGRIFAMPGSKLLGQGLLVLAASFLIIAMFSRWSRRARLARGSLAAALAIVLVIFISRCSAGGGGSSTERGTPPGTYVIEIQGTSGALHYGSDVTLVVQ